MVPTTLLNRINEYPFLDQLSSIYQEKEFKLFLVGGAVRDFILDIDTTDFDFTTNASPEESLKLLNENGFRTTKIGIKSLNVIDEIAVPKLRQGTIISLPFLSRVTTTILFQGYLKKGLALFHIP